MGHVCDVKATGPDVPAVQWPHRPTRNRTGLFLSRSVLRIGDQCAMRGGMHHGESGSGPADQRRINHAHHKQKEGPVVGVTNTIVEPRAVVVHPEDTPEERARACSNRQVQRQFATFLRKASTQSARQRSIAHSANRAVVHTLMKAPPYLKYLDSSTYAHKYIGDCDVLITHSDSVESDAGTEQRVCFLEALLADLRAQGFITADLSTTHRDGSKKADNSFVQG